MDVTSGEAVNEPIIVATSSGATAGQATERSAQASASETSGSSSNKPLSWGTQAEAEAERQARAEPPRVSEINLRAKRHFAGSRPEDPVADAYRSGWRRIWADWRPQLEDNRIRDSPTYLPPTPCAPGIAEERRLGSSCFQCCRHGWDVHRRSCPRPAVIICVFVCDYCLSTWETRDELIQHTMECSAVNCVLGLTAATMSTHASREARTHFAYIERCDGCGFQTHMPQVLTMHQPLCILQRLDRGRVSRFPRMPERGEWQQVDEDDWRPPVWFEEFVGEVITWLAETLTDPARQALANGKQYTMAEVPFHQHLDPWLRLIRKDHHNIHWYARSRGPADRKNQRLRNAEYKDWNLRRAVGRRAEDRQGAATDARIVTQMDTGATSRSGAAPRPAGSTAVMPHDHGPKPEDLDRSRDRAVALIYRREEAVRRETTAGNRTYTDVRDRVKTQLRGRSKSQRATSEARAMGNPASRDRAKGDGSRHQSPHDEPEETSTDSPGQRSSSHRTGAHSWSTDRYQRGERPSRQRKLDSRNQGQTDRRPVSKPSFRNQEDPGQGRRPMDRSRDRRSASRQPEPRGPGSQGDRRRSPTPEIELQRYRDAVPPTTNAWQSSRPPSTSIRQLVAQNTAAVVQRQPVTSPMDTSHSQQVQASDVSGVVSQQPMQVRVHGPLVQSPVQPPPGPPAAVSAAPQSLSLTPHHQSGITPDPMGAFATPGLLPLIPQQTPNQPDQPQVPAAVTITTQANLAQATQATVHTGPLALIGTMHSLEHGRPLARVSMRGELFPGLGTSFVCEHPCRTLYVPFEQGLPPQLALCDNAKSMALMMRAEPPGGPAGHLVIESDVSNIRSLDVAGRHQPVEVKFSLLCPHQGE